MKRALVTGYAGFAGRHFTATLRARGYEVTGVDPAIGDLDAAADECYAGDCRWYFDAYPRSYDLIVHCAAHVGGREVIDRSPLANSVNLDLDAAMFRYATATRAGRVLYISSAAVYPVGMQRADGPAVCQLDEDYADWRHPLLPDQVYGWAKLTGEMLADKARAGGVPVTVVRPFSGYGTDQDPSYPFPAMIARGVARSDPFEVWGPGTQVRDFVHIWDVVECAVALAEAGVDGPVNIGTGTGTSMTALARMICDHVGYSPEIVTRPDMPSGVAVRVAGTARMLEHHRKPLISLGGGIAVAVAAAAAAAPA